MKIVSLVENNSSCELKPVHGLCLYIETRLHKILFDMGPDKTFINNAKKKNIDLSLVDIVVISHGHIDHGGGLKYFLEINSKAKIYIQGKAFDNHYTKLLFLRIGVGIDKKLINHPNIVLLDGDYKIDDELMVFMAKGNALIPPMNKSLLDDKKKIDSFQHEQNLLIVENKNIVLMGCGHRGVINIMNTIKDYRIDACIGGLHTFNPVSKRNSDKEYLSKLANELKSFDTTFYTCHCTGKHAFSFLSERLDNMNYLSCGEEIEFTSNT